MVKQMMDRRQLRACARMVAASVAFSVGAAALAQQPADGTGDVDYLDQLKTCQQIADAEERLACYDSKVGAMVSANAAGDVRLVDREDVRRTRRQLFGFTVPQLDILEGDKQDKEASELFQTRITGARQVSSATWRFTTEEGAVWEINRPPRRLAAIKAGDEVEFKKAALGTYFIRINGQMGVKGRRVE